VIVMEVRLNDERINLLREIDFPFSMIGRCVDTTGIGYVDIDFEQTMQEAVAYLAGWDIKKLLSLTNLNLPMIMDMARFFAARLPSPKPFKRPEGKEYQDSAGQPHKPGMRYVTNYSP